MSNNVDDVTQSVQDVQKFTGALAENSDAVANLIDNVSAASAGIADATSRLEGIVNRGEELLAATDPEQVRAALDNIVTVTDNLATQSQNLDQILARADTIAGNLESFSAQLPAIGERSSALMAAIDPEQFAGTVERLNTIVASIDPEQVRSTVAGLSSLAQSIEANRESIDTVLTQAGVVAGNLATFSQRLPAIGERGDALIAAINPAQVSETIQRLDTIVASIEPEGVRSAVDGFSSLGQSLEANRANIDIIMSQAAQLSTDLAAVAERLPAMSERTSQLLTAINPERLEQTLANVDTFSQTLAANSRGHRRDHRGCARPLAALPIGRRRRRRAARQAEQHGGRGHRRPDHRPAGDAGRRPRCRERHSMRRSPSSAAEVGDFSDRGLRDLQNLIAEGQRTISRLDGVISNLEQNPSSFIFGGETVPEYGGQRR